MTSGSRKGTQIYFSFLSKAPANKPPPGSPTGPLQRGRPAYRAFYITLKNLIFRVPQRRSPPRDPLYGIPCRDMPHHKSPPSFIHQSPWYTSPTPHTRSPSDGKGTPHSITIVHKCLYQGNKYKCLFFIPPFKH
jgi:hypothetical protein